MQCYHPKTDMPNSKKIFHDIAHYMGHSEMGPSDIIKIVTEWIEKATEKERGVFGKVSNMLLL